MKILLAHQALLSESVGVRPSMRPSGTPPVLQDTPLAEVARRMEKGAVDELAVVDEDAGFLGIITRTSLLEALLEREGDLLHQSRRFDEQSKRLEHMSARRGQLDSASKTLLGVLLNASSEERLLNESVELFCSLLGARYAAIALLDAEGAIDTFVYAGISAEQAERIGSLPQGRGLFAVVVSEREPLRLRKLSRDPRSEGFPPNHPPMESLLAVPIAYNGTTYGRFYACEKQQNGAYFDEEDETLAISFARMLGISLAAAREYERRTGLETELRQAHKLEAIGSLAGGIAHDFNNLLVTILGNAELAMSKSDDNPSLITNLRRVLKAGYRAKRLVAQMLTFSRQDKGNQAPIAIAEVVNETLDFLTSSLSATVELRRDICQDAGLIMGNEVLVQQVIMNICTNAYHALGDSSGTVSVSLQRADDHVDTAGGNNQDGVTGVGFVKLTISDTGHGMDEKTQARIFDPFFTTKPVGKGTGMGLAVVHGVIESHRGSIEIRSTIGEGTTFTIHLPRCESPCSAEGQPAARPARGCEHVLLVDDEPEIVSTTRDVLEHLGYQVTAVTSSIEAARLFQADPLGFDIVLTDQAMPQMSGCALAEVVRTARPDTPIVVATGYSEVVNRDNAKRRGFRRYLEKPYEFGELASAIRGALDETVTEE